MREPRFLAGEMEFIRRYYDRVDVKELTDKLNNSFHNKRSMTAIYFLKVQFKKERGIREPAARVVLEKQKVAALSAVFCPRVGLSLKPRNIPHPAIKSQSLIELMEKTNTSLWDIAKAIRIDIDDVRLMIRNGGLPKIYAWPVIKMYRQMGVSI